MNLQRARINVRGAVQGVGFRPFVFRLANRLGLSGWVFNSPQGVSIEIEGALEILQDFRLQLEREKPQAAMIQAVELEFVELVGDTDFSIRESVERGDKTALILPDIATCPDCLEEIFDPDARRYLYPFTNCTHCGPRFSIIESLPYDRPNTAMKSFPMCPLCEREYHDPNDRRFHAQPIACPNCGPQLELWDSEGRTLHRQRDALRHGARAVQAGQILAMKGLGGFQLIVDARNEEALQRLRARKHREEKPFAVLFPSLDSIMEHCRVTEAEENLLLSPQAPIVLLENVCKDFGASIAQSVAPANPYLGAMLPCSPLHYLLMAALGFPVVATSGNVSDEPICIDEHEAVARLRGIADIYLVHNRPIVRHMDDSVVRVVLGRELVLRAGRGYAPSSISMNARFAGFNSEPILATGAHMKNTVALNVGAQVILSQHIGDLETEQAFAAFQKATLDLPRLYDIRPEWIACDLHPEYASTRFAREQSDSSQCIGVQHHHAHVLACMSDNDIDAPALGVCWDGTGYGLDETIWGGEFLLIDDCSFDRVAHLRQFRLPGGDAAARQPRRSAIGILYEIFGPGVFTRRDLIPTQHFSRGELRMFEQMLAAGVNSPLTSSAGRLFDGVASLLGLRQYLSFEGQAAMELEFAIEPGIEGAYPFDVREEPPLVLDWQPAILSILAEVGRCRTGVIAAKFHNTLAEMIVRIAQFAGEDRIVLTGGCFQNKYLVERSVRKLREEGFTPYWHRRVPPNDGGIALGQVAGALKARQLHSRSLVEGGA